MDEPLIVQSLWIGNGLSTMEQLCIKSFQNHGYAFHLYTYGKLKNVPPETILKDANEILPESAIFKDNDQDSYLGFSNWFRYKLLFEKGGWWVDMDVVCIKQFDFPANFVFMGQVDPLGNTTNCAVAKVLPRTPLMQTCMQACETKGKDVTWGQTGSTLFTPMVKRFLYEVFIKEPVVFCPVGYQDFEELLKAGRWKTLHEKTYAVHLWQEMWCRNNKDKDGKYPRMCLYERLKKMYL